MISNAENLGAITADQPEAAWNAAKDCAHLVFVPDPAAPHFMLWGKRAMLHPLAVLGETDALLLPDETLSLKRVRGYAIPLLEGVARLAASTQSDLSQAPASIAAWSLAAKLALELIARGCIAPRIVKQGDKTQARWSVTLGAVENRERAETIAKAFPAAAHAISIGLSTPDSDNAGQTRVWTPQALLRTFLDTVADQTMRQAAASLPPAALPAKHEIPWPQRLLTALTGSDPHFDAQGLQERNLLRDLEQWVQPVLGHAVSAAHICFELALPQEEGDFQLNFGLQAAQDSDARFSARAIFADAASVAKQLHDEPRRVQEQLLQGLAIAARSFPPIADALRRAQPEGMELNAKQAWDFIANATPALRSAGMTVLLPETLQPERQQRLRMRMCIASAPGSRAHLLPFKWQAQLAGHPLSIDELQTLTQRRTPLLRYREQWVVLDPAELEHATRLLAKGGGELSMAAALSVALTETLQHDDSSLRIEVSASGELQQLVDRLRQQDIASDIPAPQSFQGSLRPYQQRGLAWLAHLSQLKFGACLADDMGLGKTVQLLAYLLHRREDSAEDGRPILLVCPTSVLGNWERERVRFAPSLPVAHHYGAERARNAEAFAQFAPGTLVLTSYGLLRRDAVVLKEIDWAAVVLDEAQHIKNARSATARAARSLHATARIALTGTPMENRLDELWSISEFLNPGLLGSLEGFRREVAMPIERYGRDDVAAKLRKVIAPFLLRRVKSDTSIIQDLPEKLEMKVFCSLTREQAALYQAVLDESLADISEAEGMQRRGRVLALITALKQICNHPAQYLREQGPLSGRSGKLDRLCEMMEEVLASGDRALVFTQYREMGDRLVRRLSQIAGTDVPFLHGGVPRAAREFMVRRFQNQHARGPRIFVISLKAGGTGLNLTAANHVFHFDRWWNPAVEDQATDRAFRIGQQQAVQVHKLLCAGTIEEKVDRLLESKRDLAGRIVGAGESWLTELDNQDLRELLSLAPDAVVEDDEDFEASPRKSALGGQA